MESFFDTITASSRGGSVGKVPVGHQRRARVAAARSFVVQPVSSGSPRERGALVVGVACAAHAVIHLFDDRKKRTLRLFLPHSFFLVSFNTCDG